jgi:hypothetical protein
VFIERCGERHVAAKAVGKTNMPPGACQLRHLASRTPRRPSWPTPVPAPKHDHGQPTLLAAVREVEPYDRRLGVRREPWDEPSQGLAGQIHS